MLKDPFTDLVPLNIGWGKATSMQVPSYLVIRAYMPTEVPPQTLVNLILFTIHG